MDPKAQNNNPEETSAGGISQEIQDFVNKTINDATKSHLSRFAKSFEKRFDEFAETLSGRFASQPEPEDAGEVEAAKKAQSDEARMLQRKMEQLEKKYNEERAAREQEHSRRLQNEERAQLTEALREAGVADDRLKGALALLYAEEKRVARTEDGALVFKVDREGYVDELPLTKGVKEWAESAHGKPYLPAREVAGSGARGGNAPGIGRDKSVQQGLGALGEWMLGKSNE